MEPSVKVQRGERFFIRPTQSASSKNPLSDWRLPLNLVTHIQAVAYLQQAVILTGPEMTALVSILGKTCYHGARFHTIGTCV